MHIIPTKRRTRRLLGTSAAVILGVTGVLGAQSFAGDDDNTSETPPPPPGKMFVPPAPAGTDGDPALGSDTLIQTSGPTFDETILTKFIPASGFDPFEDLSFDGDLIDFDNGACFRVDSSASGSKTRMWAPLELPDGARIKQLSFHGEDSFAAAPIIVRLKRYETTSTLNLAPMPPTIGRSNTIVDSFSTSGAPGNVILLGTDDLEELTGTPFAGTIPLTNPTRFHTVEVDLDNDADADHVLCGVVVEYQVAASSADPGTTFHPIDPVRAFDSRLGAFPNSGLLAPNTDRVVSVADGYDATGAAIPAQADSVPANATAVTYNITVAGATGSNFVSVTAGDAASFTASAINYSAGSNVANAGTVTIDDDREIKLWGGDGTGSAHVIIDITGFFAPAPPPPNMGN